MVSARRPARSRCCRLTRAPAAGWQTPGFDDSGWLDARTDSAEAITPVARTAPPVRATEELPVAEVITTPSGRTVLDFGQNLVGHLRIRVSGREGDTVVVLHGGPFFSLGYIAADLEPLADRHVLLFYDQRGSGRSTLVADSLSLDARHLGVVRRWYHRHLSRITITHSKE